MQTAGAVELFHSQCIDQGNFQAEDILLNSQENIKISGFGLGQRFAPEQTIPWAASWYRMLPQNYSLTKYFNDPVDVWSCRVILCQLVVAFLPFCGNDCLLV